MADSPNGNEDNKSSSLDDSISKIQAMICNELEFQPIKTKFAKKKKKSKLLKLSPKVSESPIEIS